MCYYVRKRRKSLVLDLLRQLFPYVILFVLGGLVGNSCVAAIDKHQEQYELSPADRAAVVATWSQ
ncbi:MAG: hypothetical protein EHM79_02095 [Geobacter sp.]|nr:MAG: hypothetical protein EHM79_02095 [Geobacter sp.]